MLRLHGIDAGESDRVALDPGRGRSAGIDYAHLIRHISGDLHLIAGQRTLIGHINGVGGSAADFDRIGMIDDFQSEGGQAANLYGRLGLNLQARIGGRDGHINHFLGNAQAVGRHLHELFLPRLQGADVPHHLILVELSAFRGADET